MEAVAEYQSSEGDQRSREKSLWLWCGIYAGAGVVFLGLFFGYWKILLWVAPVRWNIWAWGGFVLIAAGTITGFSLSLWCIQRMIEKMPRQWVWCVTLLVVGIAAAVALAVIYFSARHNDASSRMRLLISAIVIGVLGVLILGQAMRCNRIAAESKIRPRWLEVVWSVSNHAIMAVQLACAVAAVGAGIVMGFGYPVP